MKPGFYDKQQKESQDIGNRKEYRAMAKKVGPSGSYNKLVESVAFCLDHIQIKMKSKSSQRNARSKKFQ